MELIYNRCCGLDIHKDLIVASIFVGRKKEIRSFGTITDEILKLASWLNENEIQAVAMEATGVYWKPIYNLLEEEPFKILVVNAQFIKGVPGRKTDVKDSEWICNVTRHGLVKNSYIPSRNERELREITRYRQSMESALQDKKGVCYHYAKLLKGVLKDCGIQSEYMIGDFEGVGMHCWLRIYDPDNYRYLYRDATKTNADLANGLFTVHLYDVYVKSYQTIGITE